MSPLLIQKKVFTLPTAEQTSSLLEFVGSLHSIESKTTSDVSPFIKFCVMEFIKVYKLQRLTNNRWSGGASAISNTAPIVYLMTPCHIRPLTASSCFALNTPLRHINGPITMQQTQK